MGRIISAAGTKGGVGKSTIATHLAAWLHEQGQSVAFVDADRTRSGSRFITEVVPEIHVERAETSDDLLDGLPELARDFDVTVVDCAAGDDEATRAALFRSDFAILPTGPGALDLRALIRTAKLIQQVQSVRGGSPAAVVVLNRLRKRTRLTDDARGLAEQSKLPVASTELFERVGLADCVGQSALAWTYEGAAESGRELRALFEEIIR